MIKRKKNADLEQIKEMTVREKTLIKRFAIEGEKHLFQKVELIKAEYKCEDPKDSDPYRAFLAVYFADETDLQLLINTKRAIKMVSPVAKFKKDFSK